MAATAETQAYVTEVQSPTILTAAASRQAIRQYGAVLHKVAEQMSIYARLRHAGELDETDAALEGLLAGANMRIGAVMTTYTELQRRLRDLAIHEAALAQVNQRIVDRAAEL